jgi:hypothetical protein
MNEGEEALGGLVVRVAMALNGLSLFTSRSTRLRSRYSSRSSGTGSLRTGFGGITGRTPRTSSSSRTQSAS